MEESEVSVISEKGGSVCFICLDLCEHKKYTVDCRDNKINLSFNLILRYLEIDTNSFKYSPSEDSSTEVAFCDKCDSLLNQFKDWYQDFEMIRLYMTGSLQSLEDLIKQSEKNKCRVKTGPLANIGMRDYRLDKLRHQFLRKCSFKHLYMPKVKLKRIGPPKKAGDECDDKAKLKIETYLTEQMYRQNIPASLGRTEICQLENNDITTTPIIKEEPNEINSFGTNVSLLQNQLRGCFVCLDQCEGEGNPNFCNQNYAPFKFIMRFVEIDLTSTEEVDVNLCDKCDYLVNQFWGWYQDFEVIRLYLDNCVQTLYYVMRQPGRIEGITTTSNVRWIALREQVFKRCSRKLTSIPKVNLEIMRINCKTNNDGLISKKPVIKNEPMNFEDTSFPDSFEYIDSHEIDIKMGPSELEPSFQTTTEPTGSTTKGKTEVQKTTTNKYDYKKYRQYYEKYKNNPRPRLKCRFCPKSYISSSNTNLHMMAAHTYQFYLAKIPSSIKEEKFQKVVNKILSRRKSYGNRNLGCPYCPKCARDTLLKCHILDTHFDKILLALENPEHILLAPQSFHVVKENESGFKCDQCGKILSGKLTLQRHLRIHAGVLSCSICEHKFGSPNKLRYHEILVHTMSKFENELPPGTTENQLESVVQFFIDSSPKLICVICKKVQHGSLRMHLLMYHFNNLVEKLETVPEENLSKFKCPKCKKTFQSLHLLSKHRNTGRGYLGQNVVKSGEGVCTTNIKHKCPHCANYFSKTENLRLHMVYSHVLQYLKAPKGISEENVEDVLSSLMAAGEMRNQRRVMSCSICKKSFGRKNVAKKHILSSHDKVVKNKLNKISLHT